VSTMLALACVGAATVRAADPPAPTKTKAPSHVALAEKMMATLEALAAALEPIRAEAGAKAAVPKLKQLYADFFAETEEIENLPPPSPAEERELDRFQEKSGPLLEKIMIEEERLGADPGIKAVLDKVKADAVALDELP
jgi:hypothetical protein